MSSGAADLYDVVWFPNADWTAELADLALPENWMTRAVGDCPILYNYFKYYARRAVEEKVWVESVSAAGTRVAAFDTGLLSRHFEPINAVFEENRNASRQPWVHKEWARPASPRLRDFDRDALRRVLFFPTQPRPSTTRAYQCFPTSITSSTTMSIATPRNFGTTRTSEKLPSSMRSTSPRPRLEATGASQPPSSTGREPERLVAYSCCCLSR